VQTLPARNVLFLGASRQEAFRYVKGDWNPRTADEYIKLAEWCRSAGLIREALDEAKAAAIEAPPDPSLAKMLRELKAAWAKRPEDRTVRIVRPEPFKVSSAATTTKISDKPAVVLAVEKSFGLKIQPILTNLCVSCHADGKKRSTYVLG